MAKRDLREQRVSDVRTDNDGCKSELACVPVGVVGGVGDLENRWDANVPIHEQHTVDTDVSHD